MAKYLVLKVSDEFYEELKKRAEEEGFALVTDYILQVLSREMERAPFNPRELEARIERIEKGELPPPLQEAIWALINEALVSKLGEGGEVKVAIDEDSLVKKVVEEAVKKLERKITDMINPWSQKVDALQRQVGEIVERIEALEEALREVKTKEERVPQVERMHEKPSYERAPERPRERRRKSAIDILRERKVNFEEDMAFARNIDRLIDKLRREGAIVIETTKHGRIVVHPEAWEEFWGKLKEAGPSDEEVVEALDDERLFRLFKALREDGLIYYDPSEGWTASPDLRREISGNV